MGWCIAHAATRTAAAESDRVSCVPSSFFPLYSSLLLFLAFRSSQIAVSLLSYASPCAPIRSSPSPVHLPFVSGFPSAPLEPPRRDGYGPAAVLLTALRVCDCKHVCACVCVCVCKREWGKERDGRTLEQFERWRTVHAGTGMLSIQQTMRLKFKKMPVINLHSLTHSISLALSMPSFLPVTHYTPSPLKDTGSALHCLMPKAHFMIW